MMNENTINVLVSEYEAMSQQGTVGFFEEAVFLQLFKFYEKESLPEKALDVINHALTQYQYSADLYIHKAQLLIEHKFETQALDCLDIAASLAPTEFDIFLLKAEALTSLDLLEEASEILENLKMSNLNNRELSEVYLFEALTYENQREFEKMFYALQKAILTYPKNRIALERLWISVEFAGKYPESVDLHNKLIDLDPYNYIAWYNLGHAYFALENYTEAADAFEYAYLINENFEFAYRDCAKACIKLSEYERAVKCLNEALEIFEPDTAMLLKVGFCYQNLGKTHLAKTFFQKCIKLEPNNAQCYFHLGETFRKENSYDSAIISFRKAISLDDLKEEYYSALAEAYYKINEIDKAQMYFLRAIDTAPEINKYWIQYASFLMETGELDKALEILEESVHCAPGTELIYCKVACLFLLDKRKDALHLLNDALIENFELHDSLFKLIPNLERDIDIMALVSIYKPE